MFGIALTLALAIPAATPPPVDVARPPPAETVFAIPDELRENFNRQVLSRTRSREQRLYKLVEYLIEPSGLGLKYKSNATLTVGESYRNREVNCMAFTMLALALAREAGLPAYPQQIDRVMAWSLSGNVVTQSLHANAVIIAGDRKHMVDIAGGNFVAPVVDYKISDSHFLALFYGNRAMELFSEGHVEDALLWQQEALKHETGDASLWNNAGVLYQRLGDSAAAEASFLKAVQLNSRLGSTVSNLVAFYEARGSSAKAAFWQARADRILRSDPYFQFTEARRYEEVGNLDVAVSRYRRAVSLNREEPVFHFFLARAYYKLGRLRDAKAEMRFAAALSNQTDRVRYQSKLEALQRMKP